MPVVVEVLALSVLWLIVALRLRALNGTAQQRATMLIFLFFALSGTLTDRVVRHAVDTATGVADLSILLGHMCAMLGVISIVELDAAVTGSRRGFRRVMDVVIVLMMTCMITLFLFIPRRLDQPDFGRNEADIVVIYQMLFQTSVAIGLITAVKLFFPQWRSAPRGSLRTALLLLWLGSTIGLVYVVNRMCNIVSRGLGRTLLDGPPYEAATSILLYTSLLAVGAAGLVRVFSRCHRYLRRHAGYRHLQPLWTTLTNAVPGTVLEPPPHPLLGLVSVKSLELRLYRRVIEIRDAQMELNSYVSPEMRDTAREALRDHDNEHALDACVLRMGLSMARNGAAPRENPTTSTWQADISLDAEVANLLALSRLIHAPEVIAAAEKTISIDSPRTPAHGDTDIHHPSIQG